LIQDGFPLKLLDMVIPGQSISMRLLEKGVILEMAPDAYKVIGILRYINKTIREQYEKKNKGREWHKRFRDAFLQLYKTTSNPSFYRQAHYHAVLGGDTINISAFNIPELSRCVQSWYDTRQLRDALWGYQQIKKYRQLTAKESMHEASSLMRTNSIPKGKEAYKELMRRYPNWSGLRNSLIDSLIATGKYAEDALDQLKLVKSEKRDSYWHRQAARCYRQLEMRPSSYKEYEKAILSAPSYIAYPIIKELITYAKEIDDVDVVEEWEGYSLKILKLSA
jgi:hypothetical protein